MQLDQKQALAQKLALTHSMLQSLDCLQLSAQELDKYIEEIALSNPLLDVQSSTWYETHLPSVTATDAAHAAVELRESSGRYPAASPEETPDVSIYGEKEQSFRDYLNEQIGQMKFVDGRFLTLCRFLIGCLNERGYLDCPIEELAAEAGCSAFELEQALYAVQMLDPPGVGARSLSECLVLQLAQGKAFNPLTLAIAREGLEYLGRRDYAGLAEKLGVSVDDVRAAAKEITELSPIPARGFAGESPIEYIAPDAEIHAENGHLVAELNGKILPRLSVNTDYSALLNDDADAEVKSYVKEKLTEAQELIKSVHTRCDTFLQLVTVLADMQQDFFLHGGELAPVTMQQVAERMGVNVSTVSRAAQNKYLEFQGKLLPVRSLFTAAIRSDAAVSNYVVKQQIRSLIRDEDPSAPLSDEDIRIALDKLGITVSRRAVAKYRTAMEIPASVQRKGMEK